MKILFFLIANGIGFLSSAIVWYYAVHNNLVPNHDTMPTESTAQFSNLFFGGTLGVWLVSGALSILFFFLKGGVKIIFLLLPLLIPIIYAATILNAFNS